MTYENFRKNIDAIMADEARINAWRKNVQRFLLIDLAPRIAALAGKTYPGSGFHYEKERTLGNLIVQCSKRVSFSAVHCAKIEDALTDQVVLEVLYEGLVEDVAAAEA